MLVLLSERNYEASVWTLQDEFITVLKWSGINNLGLIELPKMSISDDGTEKLTFSIPMYIRVNGELEVNPNWYNLKLGALMEGTRKIKIILNKGEGSSKEAVYEFVITSVTEKHSGDTLICEVTCEGACFHELGKIGYKIALSAETFLNEDYEKWKEGKTLPVANIDYWNKKAKLLKWKSAFNNGTEIPNPRIWYYLVKMDTSQYTGERSSSKVYEDAYVSNWELKKVSGNSEKLIVASDIEEAKEKERMIDVKESNLYNITLTIAETFNVFCRYEYGHDENYHITYRKVIYYNNFIKEKEGAISLTYPYTADEITRTKDSTDIVTKLYVLNITNDNTASGIVTIMDSDVNDMKEDYLLNFDYLHEVQSVTDAQYEVIKKFKAEIREINDRITILQEALNAILALMPAAEAEVTTLTNSITECDELINTLNSYVLDLVSRSDNKYTKDNFKTMFLFKGENDTLWLLDVSNIHGIKPKTIHLYTAYRQTTHEAYKDNDHPECPLDWTYDTDVYGNVILLKNITYPITTTSSSPGVYVTCTFNPGEYHTNITNYWKKVKLDHKAKRTEKKNYYNNLKAVEKVLSKKLDNEYSTNRPYYGLYLLKDQILENFLMLMGPAMREGFWNPLEYNDYSDRCLSTIRMYKSPVDHTDSLTTSDKAHKWALSVLGPNLPVYYRQDTTTPRNQGFMWDSDLFTSEEDVSYSASLTNSSKNYNYPCVDLRGEVGEHLRTLLSGEWVVAKKEDQSILQLSPNVKGSTSTSINTITDVLYIDSNNSQTISTTDIEGNATTIEIAENNKMALTDIGFIYRAGTGSYTTTDENGVTTEHTDMTICSFNIGSLAQLAFLRNKTTGGEHYEDIVPVLMLTGAKSMSENSMGAIYNTRGKLYYPSVDNMTMIRGADEDISVPTNYTLENVPQVTIGVVALGISGSGSTTTLSTVVFGAYDGRLKFLTSSVPSAMENGLEGNSSLELMDYKNEWKNNLTYEIVYPRIRINSLNVKHNSTDLKVKLVRTDVEPNITQCLTEYEDYSFLIKADKISTLESLNNIDFSSLTLDLIEEIVDNSTELLTAVDALLSYTYITIKPETFYKYGMINFTGSGWNLDGISLVIEYYISNAGTCIYIDAKDVLRENSLPKVTYTVNPSRISTNVIKNPKTWLDRIVSVNDSELHFLDVKGYISDIELDLDHPELDSIEIKNYKSKFEDLFSSIIALTESMKKREYTMDVISSVFTGAGTMTGTALENSINGVDLDLAFSQGTLTISDKDGIWGTSPAGVVAFRGGGIFTANLKNSDGNWKWNSGILPSGINGSLITAGLIDTSKVVIMSGKLKYFLWNTDGLYAYKSPVVTTLSAVPALYVVYNGEGLALVAPVGCHYYGENGEQYTITSEDVKRVEIGWDGLTLRNYNGNRTLWMDASTGNLSLTGSVTATSFILGTGVTIPESGVAGLTTDLSNINSNINSVSNRVTTAEGYIEVVTKSTRKIYYLTAENDGPSVPGSNTTIYDSYLGTGLWCYSYPKLPSTNDMTTGTSTSDATKNDAYKYYTTTLIISSKGTITYSPNPPVIDLGVTSAMTAASIAAITSTAFMNNGLKAGISWGGHYFSVALTSTDSLLIGATSSIWIAKPSSTSYSDGAAVTIDSSGIAMKGSTISLANSGGDTGIKIGKLRMDGNNEIQGIEINTNGIFEVSSTNFTVNTSTGVVSIKGAIEATSGKIGNLNITQLGGLYFSSSNGYSLSIYAPNLVDERLLAPAIDLSLNGTSFFTVNYNYVYSTGARVDIMGKLSCTSVISCLRLEVTNDISANSVVAGSVAGGAMSGSSLSVTNGISGGAISGSTITASGLISANNGLTIASGKTLTANGAIEAKSTLTITGTCTANGAIDAKSTLDVTGKLIAKAAVDVGNALTVSGVINANDKIRLTSSTGNIELHATTSSTTNADNTVTYTFKLRGRGVYDSSHNSGWTTIKEFTVTI